jgi:hypothetical protein
MAKKNNNKTECLIKKRQNPLQKTRQRRSKEEEQGPTGELR